MVGLRKKAGGIVCIYTDDYEHRLIHLNGSKTACVFARLQLFTYHCYICLFRNMVLKEVRNYIFKQYPEIYSKVSDLPPAKYNPGSVVKNSLVASLIAIHLLQILIPD